MKKRGTLINTELPKGFEERHAARHEAEAQNDEPEEELEVLPQHELEEEPTCVVLDSFPASHTWLSDSPEAELAAAAEAYPFENVIKYLRSANDISNNYKVVATVLELNPTSSFIEGPLFVSHDPDEVKPIAHAGYGMADYLCGTAGCGTPKVERRANAYVCIKGSFIFAFASHSCQELVFPPRSLQGATILPKSQEGGLTIEDKHGGWLFLGVPSADDLAEVESSSCLFPAEGAYVNWFDKCKKASNQSLAGVTATPTNVGSATIEFH